MDEKKSYGLTYIKLYVDEIELMETALTPELAALLLFAIGNYAKDSTVREVPQEIKFAFADFQRKIDLYRKSCAETSKKRAESGAKGGKAKAARAKGENSASSTTPKFKPPTKQEFKNAVYQWVENNDFDEKADQADIEAFYDHLRENGWKVCERAVSCRDDWETLISAKFYMLDDGMFMKHITYSIFLWILENAKNADGELTFKTAYDFMDDFFEPFTHEGRKCGWYIKGQFYSEVQWEEAADAYFSPAEEESAASMAEVSNEVDEPKETEPSVPTVPTFATEEEAREYWQIHDLS